MKYFKFFLGLLVAYGLLRSMYDGFRETGGFNPVLAIIGQCVAYFLFGWLAFYLLRSPFKKERK